MQNKSFGYVPGYVGEIKISDLFFCGVIVKEHGDPVIGVPISKIATRERVREGEKSIVLI